MKGCIYHGYEVLMYGGESVCPKAAPIHIKPRGYTFAYCDSDGGRYGFTPQHVTGLMGATCPKCRTIAMAA